MRYRLVATILRRHAPAKAICGSIDTDTVTVIHLESSQLVQQFPDGMEDVQIGDTVVSWGMPIQATTLVSMNVTLGLTG